MGQIHYLPKNMPIDAKLIAHIDIDPGLSRLFNLKGFPLAFTKQNAQQYLDLLKIHLVLKNLPVDSKWSVGNKVDTKPFGLIKNDPLLSDMFNPSSLFLAFTTKNLRQYLELLTKKKISFPSKYSKLLQKSEYLENAKFFAHIENDPVLSGIYDLQGLPFAVPIQNLREYSSLLTQKKVAFPSEYSKLLEEMEYLERTEKRLIDISSYLLQEKELNILADSIAADVIKGPKNNRTLIPGGWLGHAMMYQFTQLDGEIEFMVMNSGDGIRYHAKKSAREKELYNPLKIWRFPRPVTDKAKAELVLFIERLLRAKLIVHDGAKKKHYTRATLYEEVFPTISHLKGTEVDANIDFPIFGYTGGQLSGTCTERVLHQMLKIKSKSERVYQHFIFNYKQHMLYKYAEACLAGKQPFTAAVAKQIHLAIENNLKILNIPELFPAAEIQAEAKKLEELQKRIAAAPLDKSAVKPHSEPKQIALNIYGNTLAARYVPSYDDLYTPIIPNLIHLHDGTNLLANMAKAIESINAITNPATKYHYLQQLILALPLNPNFLQDGFYQELKMMSAFDTFKKHLKSIQTALLDVQEKLFKEEQNPIINVMNLSITSLLLDAATIIPKDRKEPAFGPISSSVMQSLVGNKQYDAFTATNHPAFDKRIKALQTKYANSPRKNIIDYRDYLNNILETEPKLKAELKTLYETEFGSNDTELHAEIRKNSMQSLFMISNHINGTKKIDAKFKYLIRKIDTHLDNEIFLHQAIRIFLAHKYYIPGKIKLDFRYDSFWVDTTLYPTSIPYERLTKSLPLNKYALKKSPALDALEADTSDQTPYTKPLVRRTANKIQLEPAKPPENSEISRQITLADIDARDYFHLRGEPSLQIALTLDYFTRHIGKLADESTQRYVEANLFQPGLLLDAIKEAGFLHQLDLYLKTGHRFYSQNGQYTQNSLSFVRLDYLVSRYLVLNENPNGLIRLKNQQQELEKRLTLDNDLQVTYVIQHYLFLNLLAQLEKQPSEELFQKAYNAYFYLNSHDNPSILEDKTHKLETDAALIKFQIIIKNKPPHVVQLAVKKVLDSDKQNKNISELKGSFPIYTFENFETNQTFRCHALTGKVFNNRGLALSEVPLEIQNHPLIKHLNLQHIQQCLLKSDGTYMVLTDQGAEISLFNHNNKLTVQKEWLIDGQLYKYELQALTTGHSATLANIGISPIRTNNPAYNKENTASLPKILTDGSMDYWQSISLPNEGLLVQDNIPVYAVINGQIKALDVKGNKTERLISPFNASQLKKFENTNFMLTHVVGDNTTVELPRYNLSFKVNAANLINQDTGEKVVEKDPSPIHPDVAGLLLEQNKHERFLVPVARFYAIEHKNADPSDFFPIVHDISGVINNKLIDQKKLAQNPLWHYKNSEKYISFPLKNGEPIANTVADALYLVYIYLATNQTEKAWKTLEECNTRLGGLTGDPAELKFIAWICKDVPYILPADKNIPNPEDPKRETPPYVACQLKAMSLLCDHLIQGRTFNLKTPKQDKTANSITNTLQHEYLTSFLNALPDALYKSFALLQRMSRHLEHTYTLSTIERQRLLSYYHKQQPKNHDPKGALGFEWTKLSLEALLDERDALQAQYKANEALSKADKNRLDLIQNHLNKIKPVMGLSTQLELIAIDLQIPLNSQILRSHLKPETIKNLDNWHHKLPGSPLKEKILNEAIGALSSNMIDDEFIINFPAYLQVALSKSSWFSDPNEAIRKKLLDFCTQTLIAKRHISLGKQESNIPLLCNLLYRAVSNRGSLELKNENKFKELVDILRQLHVPPLQIYQAKGLDETMQPKPEAIIASRTRIKRVPLELTIVPALSLIAQTGVESHLLLDATKPKLQLDPLITEFNALLEKSSKELAELGVALNHEIDRTFAIEGRAGLNLFNLEKDKKSVADKLIKNNALTQSILTASTTAQASLTQQIKKSWADALKLANQGPDDPVKARTWRIERQAKARATLTRADLLSIYSRADCAFSIEKTGLNPQDSQRLHDLIHKALIQGIQNQSLKQISEQLNKAMTGDLNSATQALDILARKEIPGLDNPSIVLIQHEEGILLHKRQVSALKSLLKQPTNKQGFKETIEKIIPGGGKSKVIIPILVERKAQGNNVVVVEVPRALLATNHVDLNSTSQRLFGKRAYLFDFNRDSDCTPERLEEIYKLLIEVMTTRSYLVCAGESIQSLELKYVELLLANTKKDETWKKQVYWCDKITNLLRHNGDCIIDEVHQGLSDKKKLNYTLGEPRPLNASIIKNATALFSFIESDFIKSAPLFDQAYAWGPFVNDLSSKLINDANSPLNAFVTQAVTRYGDKIKQELVAYLNGTATTELEVINSASSDDKSSLGFFKGQMVKLTQTLVQKKDKDYGGSHKPGLSPVEKTLAIPYAGSNVPNERNRFANDLEAINKAIQKMLLEGLTEEALIERIKVWQILARQELFLDRTNKESNKPLTPGDKPSNPLDKTPTGKGFNLLTQLQLSEIDIGNKEQMKTLHKTFQFNRSLIFDFLREFTLKMIKQECGIISSDNFNHVDQYRSVQGTSGTPPLNTASYHPRLHYDRTASLGSDGYVLEVLRDKKPQISGIEYENLAQYIEAILSRSKSKERTRAIIDIKGTFTGVTNFAVAQGIAAYINKNYEQFGNPLKHVLYFNEYDVLCAIDINKPDKPIILGTSNTEEINRRLSSTPQERFTFYDQIHTLGTDLSQWEKAHAIVSIDDKTSLMDYIQGNMRAREIALAQTNEFIVPSRLEALSLENWYQKFEANEKKAIVKNAPADARGQMKNHIRTSLRNLVQDLPSEEAEKKSKLMNHFRPFFEETTSADLFALYGGVNKKQKIGDILEKYQTLLLTSWNDCLKKADLSPNAKEIQKMTVALKDIIDKAIPYCAAEYEGSSNDSYAMEVEVQNEVLKEFEVEATIIKETYSTKYQEEPQKHWQYTHDFAKYFINGASNRGMSLPLNQICSNNQKRPALFSANLFASTNYYSNYQEQKEYIDGFIKPVFTIWYHLHNNVLNAMIVTPQEARELAAAFKDSPTSWISTTQDHVLAGKRPAGILEEERYQELREQVRFFNGEFAGLLNQETPIVWMKEKLIEKTTFFENTLLPYRPGSAQELYQFRTALTQGKAEGFEYIAQHPFEDLSQFNWLSIFPKTIAPQAAEYKRVAEVFDYLNMNWRNKTITLSELQDQFRLPMNSLSYVNSHLSYLMVLKQVQWRLQMPSAVPFLYNFSQQENLCLEQCLGMSLSKLYEANELVLPPTKELNAEQLKAMSIASIKVLNILKSHPLLQNSPLFDSYFENHAKQTRYKEVLNALVVIENPSGNLIKNIFANPACDYALLTTWLKSRNDYGEDLLIIFAQRILTSEQFNLFLEQKNLSDACLQSLLDSFVPSSLELLKVTYAAKTVETLELIAKNRAVNAAVRVALLKHPAMTPDFILTLLNIRAFTEEEWLICLESASKTTMDAILPYVMKQPDISSKVILALMKNGCSSDLALFAIDHNAFSVEISEKILSDKQLFRVKPTYTNLLKKIAVSAFKKYEIDDSTKWEEQLGKVFAKAKELYLTEALEPFIEQNQAVIKAPLGLKIFAHSRVEVLPLLPFLEMIKIANEDELLNFLLNISTETIIPDAEMRAFADHVKETGQIDIVLERPEMTTELADVLFQKESYSGRIIDRDWMTLAQKYKVLDNIHDYKVLNSALDKHRLSPIERKAWLDEKIQRHNENKINAKDSRQRLTVALEGLQIKAFSHAIKALRDKKYDAVAKTAFDLYHHLNTQAQKHFKNPVVQTQVEEFKNICKHAIKQAEPILSEHRGYKQLVLDIINVLTSWLALLTTGKWRFFVAQTDSYKVLHRITDSLDVGEKGGAPVC